MAETEDESVEEPARNKRNSSHSSNGESSKRSVKRKRQYLFESDDESTKKRVHQKHKCSSDSDYEPNTNHVKKKPKGVLESNEDSAKKRAPKKYKSSASIERMKKNTATKSESLDSDEEKAQSSSGEVLKAVVPRKHTKKTPMRDGGSLDEVDDADDSTNILDKSCLRPDSNDKGIYDTDSEKPKSSSAEKGAPMKMHLAQNESAANKADDGMDITDECNSCPDSIDNGLDSDSERAKSSLVEMSKEVAPMKKHLPKNEADADEADDGMDIPDESNLCPDSNDNDLDSNAEKPCSSYVEVSTNAAQRTKMNEAPSKDKVHKKEKNSDDDFMTIPEKSGFELGYTAKKIIGITDYGPGGVKFLIQFHGREDAELVLNDKCREYCPELILKFYEKHITWKIPE